MRVADAIRDRPVWLQRGCDRATGNVACVDGEIQGPYLYRIEVSHSRLLAEFLPRVNRKSERLHYDNTSYDGFFAGGRDVARRRIACSGKTPTRHIRYRQ